MPRQPPRSRWPVQSACRLLKASPRPAPLRPRKAERACQSPEPAGSGHHLGLELALLPQETRHIRCHPAHARLALAHDQVSGAKLPTPGRPDGKKIRGDPRRAFAVKAEGRSVRPEQRGAEGWSARHRAMRSSEVTRKTPNNAQPKGRTTRPQEYGAKERSAKPEQCGAEEDSQYPSSAEPRSNPRNPSSAHRGDQWHTVGTGAGPFPC